MKSKSENKKQLIFRNLILFLTLLVCIFIAVIAWFATNEEATATGLTVKSSAGDGLEISIDNKTFSADPVSMEGVVEYPLITSNGVYKAATATDTDGLNFFLPKLDRSSGTALKDTDGNWAVKRTAVANQDYLETDVYFRSKEQLNVFLGTESKAEPSREADGTLANMSSFGDFSKNYIAGASRVGFYSASDTASDEADNKLQFIWAPNKSYHLSNGGNYSKIELKEDTSSTSGFNSNDPAVTFGLDDTTKYTQVTNMYMWEVKLNKNDSTSSAASYQMYQEISSGNYLGAITLESTSYVDHGISITTDGNSYSMPPSFNVNENKDSSQCELPLSDYTFNDTPTWVGAYFDNHTLYIGDYTYSQISAAASPTEIVNDFFALNNRFQVLIEYNPNGIIDSNGNTTSIKIKVLGFVFYNNVDGIINGGAGVGVGIGKAKYIYELDTAKSVLITAESGGTRYGLAVENDKISAKAIASSTAANIAYVNSEFLFTPEQDEGKSTYRLKHTATGKYLQISSSGVLQLAASDAASEFSLTVGDNDGPLLGCNGYYIGYASGKFGTQSTLSSTIDIFQGNAYTFDDSSTVSQDYTCLEIGKNSETALTAATSVLKDFSTTPVVDDLSLISNVPVVTLTKNETSGYYTGHIRVRIWVEGCDREAKTPLQGGKFKTTLSFTGLKVDSATS